MQKRGVLELLSEHVAILDELRSRGVLRTANNPTGDYAEHLFCKAFGWQQMANSVKSFDGLDGTTRYQIKGRRLDKANSSRQLSAIRDLNGFDFLAGVLFNADYSVLRAALIPVAAVAGIAKHGAHTNSYKMFLRDAVWEMPEVVDVTDQLRKCQTDIG